MNEQYAILNEDKTAVVEIVVGGRSHGSISFGASATIKDRQDAGLFHVIEDRAELTEYQKYGEVEEIIDTANKTVTFRTPIIEMSETEILEVETAKWKAGRAEQVEQITVTYNNDNYQGDEKSQGRMSRTVVALPEVKIDEDGTVTKVSDGTIFGVDNTATLLNGTIYYPDGTVSTEEAVFNLDGTITRNDGAVFGLDGVVTLEDGTTYSLDGTVTTPDGTISPERDATLTDGTVFKEDGTVVLIDGTIVAIDGTATLDGVVVIPDTFTVPVNTLKDVVVYIPTKPEEPASMTAPIKPITHIPWTAQDNSVAMLTREDLQNILLQAGSQQASIWNTDRPA